MSLTGSLIRSIIAPLWAMKEKSPYLKHLTKIERMHRRPVNTVQTDQLLRLQTLVRQAFENTEFYRERFEQNGLKAESVRSLEDFQRLPFLTKDDIRGNKERMIARNIPESKLVPRKTSGSTGVSVELYVDEDSGQWKRAVTVAYDRWAGWDIGERVGAIWGNPEASQNWRLYLRNLLLNRHIYLDTLNMDEVTMRSYHATLLKKMPFFVFCFSPHSIYRRAFVPFNSCLFLLQINILYFKSLGSIKILLHSLGLLITVFKNSFSIFHSFAWESVK